MRDTIIRKKLELWENWSWMLHHDNVPTHMLQIYDYLTNHEAAILSHPQSSRFGSSRLSFPKFKKILKWCYQTINNIEENTIWQLCTIPQNTFQEIFPIMEKTMGEMSYLQRGLFWKGQTWKFCIYVNKVFITYKIWLCLWKYLK